ncbi:DUF1835 domain-containing protein [Sediminitomix flava]|uniref:Uncharacterized protein DUF1835 n=1 Tax=Sediminitomix flava TaxID=379075 RepID=A0A315ZFU7_SEDFL|nr:DUF1835 domain-containing protein [Sediminitomix flava]PWJ44455.1 uncharacterized protein DUF1835 [Sediminitomix flava]
MKQTTLHILNGDSTAEIFKQTAIEGDICVCREVLCDGPLSKKLFDRPFWEMRSNFFQDYFEVDALEYVAKSSETFKNLHHINDYQQVYLWFEYDLFCQMNMLAVLAFIAENLKEGVSLQLICTGYDESENKWKTLSDFSPKAYSKLMSNSLEISMADLQLISRVWKYYLAQDYKAIFNLENECKLSFPYLIPALKLQMKRYPSVVNGLSELENSMLTFVQKHNGIPDRKIVREMLLTKDQYGLGDLQYFNYMDKLAVFFDQKDEEVSLNELGLKVLNGEKFIFDKMKDYPFPADDYSYNPMTETLDK